MELLPWVRKYKDGSVERLHGSPYVPPTPEDPKTGVATKDIIISKNPAISARLFLPKLDQSQQQKLPVMYYTRGGAFNHESVFCRDHTQFFCSLVAEARVVGVSVEYRQAPEHFLPIAYEDCWAGLQWIASHAVDDTGIYICLNYCLSEKFKLYHLIYILTVFIICGLKFFFNK